MQYEAKTVRQYLDLLPEDRRLVVDRLRQIISANLPDGFEEQISYGMIAFVVPLSRYPSGYHVKKGEPLPFISLASQKNHIALYHMGLYSDNSMLNWFSDEYQKRLCTKPDMGKSCIRFKDFSKMPYDLIEELCQKISVDDYISMYEKSLEGTR